MERLADLLDLYQLDLGSLSFVVRKLEPMLRARGDERDLRYLRRAEEKIDRASDLRYDWEQQKKKDPLDRSGTHELDARLDRALSSLRTSVEVNLELTAAPEHSRLAEEFIEGLLARGVFPLTS